MQLIEKTVVLNTEEVLAPLTVVNGYASNCILYGQSVLLSWFFSRIRIGLESN